MAISVLFTTRQADIGLAREVVRAIDIIVTLSRLQWITLSSATVAVVFGLTVRSIITRSFALTRFTGVSTRTITVGGTRISAQLFASTSVAIVTLVAISVLLTARQTRLGFTCEVVRAIYIVVALSRR